MNGFNVQNGNLAYRGILWDPHIATTGAQIDDLALTSAVLFVDATSAIDCTGFDPNVSFASDEPYGSMLWIVNVSANAVTLKHDNSATPNGHRILTPSGGDYAIAAYSQVFLIYAQKVDTTRRGWWLFA